MVRGGCLAWLIAAREAVDAVKLELTPLKVLPALFISRARTFPFARIMNGSLRFPRHDASRSQTEIVKEVHIEMGKEKEMEMVMAMERLNSRQTVCYRRVKLFYRTVTCAIDSDGSSAYFLSL